MIKQVMPIQFGGGLQNYRWVINSTDFDLTQANSTIQTLTLIDSPASPPNNVARNSTMPQGTLVLAYRIKSITAFVGTSITHAYVDIGYPANSAVTYTAATHAINGGTAGGGAGGSLSFDANAAVADANYQAGAVIPSASASSAAGGHVGMAPGDAAFGLTVSITLGGANWTALTAGQIAVDLLLWIPSMGELWTSQYYNNPSAGNP